MIVAEVIHDGSKYADPRPPRRRRANPARLAVGGAPPPPADGDVDGALSPDEDMRVETHDDLPSDIEGGGVPDEGSERETFEALTRTSRMGLAPGVRLREGRLETAAGRKRRIGAESPFGRMRGWGVFF
jgi:hypothetical protein